MGKIYRKSLFLFLLMMVSSLFLFSCFSKKEETAQKEQETATEEVKKSPSGKDVIVIGYTASQTGKFATESREQVNGLKLWAEDVNSEGGIYVKDAGKRFKVVLKGYDDESSKDRVQQLYTKLINEDKANFLISPYSSGLTASAAVVTEQYGKILIATGAASDKIFAKGYEYVYQIYTPASRYLTDAVDILKEKDPKVKKIAIVYENSNFAKSVASATKDYAEKNGFKVVIFESYEPGTTDFTSIINKIKLSGAKAVIGGGHFTDGETLAKQINDAKLQIDLLSILVAPALPEFKEIGDAALYVTGPSQWEAKVKFSKETVPAGATFYGIYAKEFVEKYKSKYGNVPGYHAAGGYAAGLVLQKAIEDAGTINSDKVKSALDKMDVYTMFGHIKFDTGEYHGRQIGHKMVIIQWLKENGKLTKEIVYPEQAATAKIVIPYSSKF
ncbi:amino acid ABC transporter substrate-binding protein [Desulfurobacterium atlanticum]|uniref:Branched-chain amino acid transport system substrate-binding protein n=1 Tax=Desulfurobacterium atlanticum TaxID=240169 RepID=A0A238Y2D7_9BACT|nr:amino acid ABC transporter substrate-binding protein [Desulfurobacterium atlanticum]SNR64978.1 branched-chain amino acid transport system substrate-binding protein [Desulfurobacterium atlanticum]